MTDRLWHFGQLLNQTDKTLLNLNLCFSAPSDLGPVDAEAVLGGDGRPRDHPFPLLDLLPCLCAQCHPTARAQTAKVRKEYWELLEEDLGIKILTLFAKEQHNGKWKWLWSQRDCDYDGENPIRHSVKSFLLRGHPSWAYIDHHWWRLSWTFLSFLFNLIRENNQ